VLFKYAAKAIAHRQSRAVTFMAQPDQLQPGSGCHLHISLRDANCVPCTAADAGTGLSEPAGRFLGGLLAFSPELTLLHAPLLNSYRRLQPGGWAPSTATWGYDHRAAMVRVVGRGPSLRLEFRLPGADANPYLSIAAALAAGIAGLEDDIALPPPWPPRPRRRTPAPSRSISPRPSSGSRARTWPAGRSGTGSVSTWPEWPGTNFGWPAAR
jgi:glutamine synthetase